MSLYLVSVAVRDEPGVLAWITRLLAKWEINLKGFVVDPAGMRLLVTDLLTLTKALDQIGFLYQVSEVHEVTIEDRPGALAEVCQQLADEGINILTAFGIATGMSGRVYLDVTDLPRATPILQAFQQGPSVMHQRLGRIGPITR